MRQRRAARREAAAAKLQAMNRGRRVRTTMVTRATAIAALVARNAADDARSGTSSHALLLLTSRLLQHSAFAYSIPGRRQLPSSLLHPPLLPRSDAMEESGWWADNTAMLKVITGQAARAAAQATDVARFARLQAHVAAYAVTDIQRIFRGRAARMRMAADLAQERSLKQIQFSISFEIADRLAECDKQLERMRKEQDIKYGAQACVFVAFALPQNAPPTWRGVLTPLTNALTLRLRHA